jgi:hypothetical protein
VDKLATMIARSNDIQSRIRCEERDGARPNRMCELLRDKHAIDKKIYDRRIAAQAKGE